MKKFKFLAAVALWSFPVALIGCGGGSGGGGTTPPTPTATPVSTPRATSTPVAGARILVIQLRDAAGNPVDGIVTVGAANQATSGGNATFRGVAAGSVTVSVEVDGNVTTRQVAVQPAQTTISTITLSPAVTPAPTATLPPPPF